MLIGLFKGSSALMIGIFVCGINMNFSAASLIEIDYMSLGSWVGNLPLDVGVLHF